MGGNYIFRPLGPHPRHLLAARLEIAKILLPQPRLLIHLNPMPRKRRWRRVRRRKCVQDTFRRLPRASVGGSEEMQGVIGTKEGAELQACGFGLLPSVGGEFDAVVGDGLVDFAVFVAFRLGVAD